MNLKPTTAASGPKQSTPPCLYAIDPAAGKTRTDLPLTYRDYDGCLRWQHALRRADDRPGWQLAGVCRKNRANARLPYRPLATDRRRPLRWTTEHYLAGFDGALLTRRYVTDAPLPTDAEQYAAAIQSATGKDRPP